MADENIRLDTMQRSLMINKHLIIVSADVVSSELKNFTAVSEHYPDDERCRKCKEYVKICRELDLNETFFDPMLPPEDLFDKMCDYVYLTVKGIAHYRLKERWERRV